MANVTVSITPYLLACGNDNNGNGIFSITTKETFTVTILVTVLKVTVNATKVFNMATYSTIACENLNKKINLYMS